MGLLLLTIVRTSEALAGELTPLEGNALKPDFSGSRQPQPLSVSMPSVPATYQAGALTEAKVYPASDFRPRGRSMLETESVGAPDNESLLHGTTIWQQLAEYRSHNRVRLVTLWETGGSSLSLQAGRKGDPSLQWTSRLMNRGGATRGLLDELFSTSFDRAGRSLHLIPRSASTEPAGKPAKLRDAGLAGTK